MSRMKVVYVDSNRQPGVDWTEERAIFDAVGADLVLANCTSDDEVVEVAGDADAILNTMYYMDADLLGRLAGVKVIVRGGVGVDNSWCRRPPSTASSSATWSTTATTRWPTTPSPCCWPSTASWSSWTGRSATAPAGPPADVLAHTGRVAGETLGLLSLRATSPRPWPGGARASTWRSSPTTPTSDPSTAAAHGVALVPLDELLARSDYISVHTPLVDETRGMIGSRSWPDEAQRLPDHHLAAAVSSTRRRSATP